MLRAMKCGLWAAVVLVAAAGQSGASVITFDTIPTGAISGPTTISEAGFDYTIVDGFGGLESGGDLEYERLLFTAGTMTVTRTGGGLFTFNSVNIQREYGGGIGTITLAGFLAAAPVASDTFGTTSGAYSTFLASALAGQFIDSLVISADQSSQVGISVNNLVLSEASVVPEPSSLTLVGLGAFGMVAGAIRRRRQTKAPV